jgi:hypothetical protein
MPGGAYRMEIAQSNFNFCLKFFSVIPETYSCKANTKFKIKVTHVTDQQHISFHSPSGFRGLDREGFRTLIGSSDCLQRQCGCTTGCRSGRGYD